MNFSNRPSQYGSPLPKTLSVLTGIGSGVIAVLCAPTVYEFTAPIFLSAVAQTYGSNFIEAVSVVWFGLMYPATYLLVKTILYVALMALISFVALRF